MASDPDLEHFPSLDECLSGKELLFSWKSLYTVASELIEVNSGRQAVELVELTDDIENVRGFLATTKIIQSLSKVRTAQHLLKPWSAFRPPDAASKVAFETKTAAINVTPTANGKYDLTQIKEDALYLSQSAKLHELIALRIVVMEFQSRARDELLMGMREEEVASLSNIMGATSSLSMSAGILRLAKSDEEYKSFSSEEVRRDRIFRTYLSEREHLVKTSGLLYQLGLHQYRITQQGGDPGKDNAILTSLGGLVLHNAVVTGPEVLLNGLLNALDAKIKGFCEDNLKVEDDDESMGIEHAQATMSEAATYMEMIFSIMDSLVDIPSSQVILRWFNIFAPYDFLDQFSSQYASLQRIVSHMKCLVGATSLMMLKLGNSLAFLQEPHNVLTSGNADSTSNFVLDDDAIHAIHNIMFDCAESRLRTTSPAVFAWSIFLITMESIMQEFAVRTEDDGFESDESGTVEGDSIDGSQRHPPHNPALQGQAARYQEILEKINDSSVADQPIKFMADSAVCASERPSEEASNSLLFDYLISLGLEIGKYDPDGLSGNLSTRIRATILDLISHGSPRLVYSDIVVNASLAAMSGGQQYWNFVEAPKLVDDPDPFLGLFEDTTLMSNIFEESARRQPYLRPQFLKLILALASSRLPDPENNPVGGTILDNRSTFTHTLPKDFRDFETKHEEDNTNLIVLTQPLQIFGTRRMLKLLSFTNRSGDAPIDQFTIPAGTEGRMVSENSEPRVVVWYHSYSGYAYLGKLLETQLGNGDIVEAISEPIDEESVADIIDIFATLLLSCKNLENPQQAAQNVLERASEGLNRTHDIINVIFDLFEHDLDNRSVNPRFHNFLGISISSVHFLHALMHFMPGRVWPFLARSRLLDTDGRGSKLSEIVAGTEIVTGNFEFLLSSIRLFDYLVEDAVSHVVSRKAATSTSLVRYGSSQDLGSGVPDQGLIRVINQFTGVLIDVFSSIHNWKIRIPEQYLQLFQLIAQTFTKIIRYVYGIGDSPDPEARSNLANPLAQAAKRIADCFLSTTPGSLHVQVILHSFVEGYIQIDYALEPPLVKLYHSRVSAMFRLTIILLKLRSMLELPHSQLEIQLFSAVALLVRLYAANESYKPLVLSLLKELVTGASDQTGEPPSLIGHLRSETTTSFLTMLLDLDRPSESDNQVSLIWQFLSAVVSNRQRTLAIIVLTGKTPRQALKTNDTSHLLEKPFLSVALDALSTLSIDTARTKLDPSPPSIAILEFVAQAQDFWPLQMGKLQSHPNFIQSISTWVENLKPPTPGRSNEQQQQLQQLEWCYSLRMAAWIAEILAMYLFRCREMGDMAPVKRLSPKFRFFKDYAVMVPNYNKSLHGNLQQNFEKKHPGLNPLMFKRTLLGRRTLGTNYFYDIVLSNKMLQHDQAWQGRRNDGHFEEFIRANINLSVVDAQIALLHGWKILAIELRNSVPEYPDLQRLFAKITTECLVSNRQDQPPEHIFDRLMQTRTDFALMAMQTLLDAQAKNKLDSNVRPAVKHVLQRVWETVENLRQTLDLAFSVGDAQYYRSLLKLLYLALQAHAPLTNDAPGVSNTPTTKPSASKEIVIALEVTNHIVARGFRELAIAIHDGASECSPEDILLLTNILAACLRMPEIAFCHDQIITHMVNNEAARVAVTLFSWSDRLAIDGDPIYGELSIGFLLELSSMKAMAEQMAVDGVLGQISSAGLANYLRRGNVSPFAEGVGPQRCYDIWVRGILPLLLNLLYSIGSLIGSEIAIFLNQFTPLLQTSLRGLEANDSNRTMSGIVLKPVISRVVSEINTLALIHRILKEYRFALVGISEIPEVPGMAALDGSAVLENAELWLASRQLLRERIMPMGQKELEMSKQKAVGRRNGCENRLEERIVEDLMGIRDILSPVNSDADS